MRFPTLNLLDGVFLGYFGTHFYLDYMVTCVTTQGPRFHRHIHRYMCLCVYVLRKTAYFFIFLFMYTIQIKERLYLTSLTFLALLNAT
jgi:hypothetical protein